MNLQFIVWNVEAHFAQHIHLLTGLFLVLIEELKSDFVRAGGRGKADLLVGDAEGGLAVHVELELFVAELVVAPVPAFGVLYLWFACSHLINLRGIINK